MFVACLSFGRLIQGESKTRFRKTKLLHQVFQPFPPILRLIQHSYQFSDNILYFIHCLYPIGLSSWVVQTRNDLFMLFHSDRAKQPLSWQCHMGWDCNCQLWAQWLAILKAAESSTSGKIPGWRSVGTNIALPAHSRLPSASCLWLSALPPLPSFWWHPDLDQCKAGEMGSNSAGKGWFV